MVDSEDGRVEYPVRIIGKSETKYRIHILKVVRLESGRCHSPGDVVLVWRDAVVEEQQ